ncbi:MAG: tetratricopeptide repeat protein [Candidatus Brocadiia bacterium]
MPISFQCPHCRVRMQLPDKFAGIEAKCPSCGNAVTITGGSTKPPVNTAANEQEDLSGWYRKMKGTEESTTPKSSLDEIHRDTKVDVSEIVTRWDENSPVQEERSSHPPELAPEKFPSTVTKRTPSTRARTTPRREEYEEEEPRRSSNMPAIIVVVGIVVVGGIVALVIGMSGGGGTDNVTPTPAAVGSASPVSGSQQPGESATPVPSGSSEVSATPTPAPTPTKALTPEEQADRLVAMGDDAKGRLDLEAAADYYEQAVAVDGKRFEVWKKLIECYLKQSKKDKALESIGKAIVALGQNAELLQMKFDILCEDQESIKDALDTGEQLVKLLNGDAKIGVLRQLFLSAMLTGRSTKSKQFLDRAWGYLEQMGSSIDKDEFEQYKENLKEAYDDAGEKAPF